ncbi:MAG: H-type lectin domain-containing protein [Thermoanaerobaculia bacterium]
MDPCRARLVERDLARLSSTHTLGRVRTGSVDLTSSSLDTEAAARGERIHRWRIQLPERFDVNPSVSILFVRVASSEERGVASITKCNIRQDGFDLVVADASDSRLFELEIEWIAYELDPPVTPLTCEEPRG